MSKPYFSIYLLAFLICLPQCHCIDRQRIIAHSSMCGLFVFLNFTSLFVSNQHKFVLNSAKRPPSKDVHCLHLYFSTISWQATFDRYLRSIVCQSISTFHWWFIMFIGDDLSHFCVFFLSNSVRIRRKTQLSSNYHRLSEHYSFHSTLRHCVGIIVCRDAWVVSELVLTTQRKNGYFCVYSHSYFVCAK